MVLQKLLRFGEGKRLRELWSQVEQVTALEPEVSRLDDETLAARTSEFKQRLENGESLDDIAFEAFATVREVAQRVLGQRPFDVQVLGGFVLHAGEIAEMRTGEGKTLTSTMPVYLNALAGKGVHVVTVNPYLAARDAEWMGRIYRFLGLEVGLVRSQQPKAEKRVAYGADITYGTNNEFGFDFLRDHMVLAPQDKVQRGHQFVIVDEVDSILIDEARTPLIISGSADQATEWYTVFARRVMPRLQRDVHYEVDEGKRNVAVTEDGVTRVEELLGVDNLYESVNTPLIHHLQNAIKARELYRRDQEYMVSDDEVLIVDEFTGRTLPGRRYSEGLHQAIEAKEGVTIKEENQTLATITLQNYFRLYDKLAGMTGTAKTEEAEFAHIYGAGVVVVPTNREIQRLDEADLIYKTSGAKFDSVADDIAERHEKGQPVLVGTVSIDKSEELSKLLSRRGIPHEVLNAKNHFKEADIVAQAGRIGAVTVATNMAGRGVDIMLGGNAEALARREAAKYHDPVEEPEEFNAAYATAFETASGQVKSEGDKVRELGGLYVLATERHESRRIDNQLRGRSGRQGDPGESRFYLSLEDDLMRLFNSSAVESIMTRLKLPEDLPIEHKMVSKAVLRAQTQVESRNFEIRKNVLKYDDVMNEQRKVVYAQRDAVLTGSDERVEEIAEDFIAGSVNQIVATFASGAYDEDWNLEELWTTLEQIYNVRLRIDELDLERLDAESLAEMLIDDAMAVYAEREEELGSPLMRQVERRVILSVADRVWREHLYEMDHLREGIGLRAVGQRDPLVEYQREAYDAFGVIMARIREEAAGYFFNLPVQRAPEPADAAAPSGDGDGQRRSGGGGRRGEIARPKLNDSRRGVDPTRLQYTAPSAANSGVGRAAGRASYQVGAQPGQTSAQAVGTPGATGTSTSADVAPVRTTAGSAQGSAADAASAAAQGTVRNEQKVGRNDPCPCGSGRKYKHCHGG